MTPEDLLEFCRELKEFFQRCEALVTAPEQYGGPRRSQVSAILNGEIKKLPEWHQVDAIVRAGLAAAKVPPPNGSLEYWRGRHAMLEVAPPVVSEPDPWPGRVRTHPAWDRASDGEAFLDDVVKLAAHLGKRRHTAERRLAGSPWLDPELTNRVEGRLADLMEIMGIRLTGAEAALLVLAPMLHRVRVLEAAASLVHVDPTRLRPDTSPGAERRRYEEFLRDPEQSRLVARTELPEFSGSVVPIGWWMFHQWSTESLNWELAQGLPVPNPRSRELYATLDRLTRLFHLTPGNLRSRRALEPEKRHLGLTAKAQLVHEERIGLLLVVAWEQALDLAALPSTIVEHLGIKQAVDLDQLRATIKVAVWEPVEGVGTGLIADCRHEAVLEALRSHVARVDAILAAAREPADDMLRRLPPHASADRVQAAEENGQPVFVTPVTRFRLDETRVRELLMGEQLYGDKSLAIRELYQNALDACRYRQARNEYLRRSRGLIADWNGRIDFIQDFEKGRHILRCTDNGVGMGESELREVFSRAGVRFADRPEYLEERAKWEAVGVDLFPNSQFGIGVLSYFMLADEIEIRTCRMNPNGSDHGEVLRVRIAGPGHLFRIEPLSEDREPGTEVTLYLRDGADAKSCVDVLQRILGIAEFDTTATHGEQRATWKPYELEPHPTTAENGIYASGVLVHAGRTDDGQVVWCEQGGGLLVDGIHVVPSKLRGVFAGLYGTESFRGAVVNLARKGAPRLTVDRGKVLDDVAPRVERLLRESAAALRAEDPIFLSLEWLARVAWASPVAADIVAEGLTDPARQWRVYAGSPELVDDGHSLLEFSLVRRLNEAYGRFINVESIRKGLASSVMICRMLTVDRKPILPSDWFILIAIQSGGFNFLADHPIASGSVLALAHAIRFDVKAMADRFADLGYDLPEIDWDSLSSEPDEADLVVLSRDCDGNAPWLKAGDRVSVGHVIAAAHVANLSPAAVATRCEFFGVSVPPVPRLPSRTTRWDAVLVSYDLNGRWPWLPDGWPFDEARVHCAAAALVWDTPAVVVRARELGFTVPDVHRTPDWLRAAGAQSRRMLLECALPHDDVVPLSQVVRTAVLWSVPPAEMGRRFEHIGLRCPSIERAPTELSERDLAILSRRWLGQDMPPGTVSVLVPRLLDIAEQAGIEMADVVARLDGLGFRLPDEEVWRSGFDDIDRWLGESQLNSHPQWENRQSFRFLLDAARESGRSMAEIADRLRRMGLEAPDVAHLRDELVEYDAILLTAGNNFLGDKPAGSGAPLALLADIASRTGTSPRRTAERVMALGYTVPSLHRLPERFDRLDLDLVRRLDLSEPVTMRDILEHALWFGLTPEEVAERLVALDLEVPDLTAELAKLMAKVR